MKSYSITHRTLVFLYGIASYILTLGIFAYTAGFLGNFLVPKPLDAPAQVPFWPALLINLGLVALFSVQHSVMARPAFKRWWTRLVPQAAERSTYVLFSCLALVALFAFWQPMGLTIWKVENPIARNTLYAL
jgi:protein-S-isoprenylcysteine O-methyltransferase Ste14